MADKEQERILEALRVGCTPFAKSPEQLVNVKASDVLALIALIDELRGKPKEPHE